MLTGEKEKTLVVGAAAGRDMEEAAASGGLEGMTPGRGEEGAGAAGKAVGDTGNPTNTHTKSKPFPAPPTPNTSLFSFFPSFL